MDDLIAVCLRFADGEHRYFLTWGRISASKQIASVAVCESLADAADCKYFYERLFTFAQRRIAFGDDHAHWREDTRRRMSEGREIFDCGPQERDG